MTALKQSHRFGPYLVINLTIGIDGSPRVEQEDRIADAAEDILIEGIEMLR